MRLLVCGGRDFSDQAFVYESLDLVHARRPVVLLIHGGARGADTLAGEWAAALGVSVQVFPADWSRFGRRAGFLRNQQMLVEGHPDGVIAFPGGAGTRMMVQLAQAAGVPVWQPRMDKGAP